MKLNLIYFSPTGGTKAVTDILAESWDMPKTYIDLSLQNEDFSKFLVEADDFTIISVPSFGGRVPAVAIERICQINGNGSKAALVCVYGNRAYDDTLLELLNTVKSRGFIPIAAIGAIAEHSIMHQFATGRPDAQDQKQLADFVEKIKLAMDLTGELSVPGNIAYREYKGLPFKIKASNDCTKCGKCAALCPVGAIPVGNLSTTDEEKCINCMRCTAMCPSHARSANKMIVFAASQKMKKVCSIKKENELFLCK